MKATKTIACVAALAMLASSVVSFQTSAAAGTITVKASDATAEPGGTFTVEVSLENVPSTKVNSIDFALGYDSSLLTIDTVEVGEAAQTADSDSTASDAPIFNSKIEDDAINISWSTGLSSEYWIASDGVIVTITGTASASAAEGTVTPITIQAIDRETYPGSGSTVPITVGYVYGSESGTYDVTTDDGSVTIGTTSVSTTEAPKVTTEAEETTTEVKETTTEAEVTTKSTEASATTASPAVTTTKDGGSSSSGTLLGDVNLDGNVALSDAVLLSKFAADVVQLSDAAKVNGDCNASSVTDANDVVSLLRFLVGIINALPEVSE